MSYMSLRIIYFFLMLFLSPTIWAQSHDYYFFTEDECLQLTFSHPSYDKAINQLMSNSSVHEHLDASIKGGKKIVRVTVFDKPTFNKNCYWSLTLYESDAEKLVFMGIYLVNVSNGSVFQLAEDDALLSMKSIKNSQE